MHRPARRRRIVRPAAASDTRASAEDRIFGNTRNSKSFSPYVDVALQGPGRMMAQGNYWGDIKPADSKGDALGEWSSVHRLVRRSKRMTPAASGQAGPSTRAVICTDRQRLRGAHPGWTGPVSASPRIHARRDDPPAPSRTIEYFERLGAGGMGEVYRMAHDTHLDGDVAVKLLPAGCSVTRRRSSDSVSEAEALSRLTHTYIATVHDLDSADGPVLPRHGVHAVPYALRAHRHPAAARTRYRRAYRRRGVPLSKKRTSAASFIAT